jgi:hypothetical protein
MPSGDVSIIISFGNRYEMIDPRTGGSLGQRSTFVAGLDDGPALVDSTGDGMAMQIDFTPIGAHRALKVPIICSRMAQRNYPNCSVLTLTDWLNDFLKHGIGKRGSGFWTNIFCRRLAKAKQQRSIGPGASLKIAVAWSRSLC